MNTLQLARTVRILSLTLTAAALLSMTGCECCQVGGAGSKPAAGAAAPAAASGKYDWVSLFDGKTLGKWKSTEFGGEGMPHVKDGTLVLPVGESLTGVTYTGQVPKMNYEVSVEAMRVDGSDFFCGLTFPVNDSFASLIIGGWGGGVCGISSLDGFDASENETTSFASFTKGKWYPVRLRVTPNKLEAWLEDVKIVDADTTGRRIGVRPEVELSEPFGFSSWMTTAALRNIRIRRIAPDEKLKAKVTEVK